MCCAVSTQGVGTQDGDRGVGSCLALTSSGFCYMALELILGLSEEVSFSPWGAKKLGDI